MTNNCYINTAKLMQRWITLMEYTLKTPHLNLLVTIFSYICQNDPIINCYTLQNSVQFWNRYFSENTRYELWHFWENKIIITIIIIIIMIIITGPRHSSSG
jgi:hypothetical protein